MWPKTRWLTALAVTSVLSLTSASNAIADGQDTEEAPVALQTVEFSFVEVEAAPAAQSGEAAEAAAKEAEAAAEAEKAAAVEATAETEAVVEVAVPAAADAPPVQLPPGAPGQIIKAIGQLFGGSSEGTKTTNAAQTQAAPTPPKPAHPDGPGAWTINEEWIAGTVRGLADGKVVVASEPERSVAVDELDVLELGNAVQLAAEWIGQDNVDLVQVGGAAGGNGVQDIHVRLTGLSPTHQIKQIVVVRRRPTPVRVWRLDTTQSPHWKLAMQRTEGATDADLYLEPTAEDFFDQELQFTVTYDDQSTAKTAVKATTKTSDQLKIAAAPAAPTSETSGPATATLRLDGEDRIQGELAAMDADSATLRTAWQPELRLPLVRATGILFGATKHPEGRRRFDDEVSKPGSLDRALVVARDNKLTTVEGHVRGMADGNLRFEYEGQERTIRMERLVGVIFAKHPAATQSLAPYQVVELMNGDRISGRLAALDGDKLELAVGDAAVSLPRTAVTRIQFRNGRLVYLSDRDPARVEETPYFTRLWTYQRNRNLAGGPLRVGGKEYAKGLAVHSRSALSYQLDGEFQSFKAVLGFDETAPAKGRVACRILGDGKELFNSPDMRADQPPQELDLPIAGVRELVLECDYGEAEDTGDRAIWANARVLRAGAN